MKVKMSGKWTGHRMNRLFSRQLMQLQEERPEQRSICTGGPSLDFMEIREGVFATVVRIRTKKLEGKTLDKWEKEFYRKNKKICDLIVEKTEQEKQEEQEINNLLG